MTPRLQVSSSPRPSLLCCHTLDDWRRIVGWCGAGRVVKSQTLLLLLQLAAAVPEGLAYPHRARNKRKQSLRQYAAFIVSDPKARRLHGTPAILSAFGLRDAAHAASLARVLAAMRQQGLSTLEIGLLVHTSREHTLRRHLASLPWTTDARNRPEAMKRLCDLRLLRLEYHRTGTNNTQYLMLHLTDAGRKLLLGQWGRAMTNAEGGMSNEAMEGRKAA